MIIVKVYNCPSLGRRAVCRRRWRKSHGGTAEPDSPVRGLSNLVPRQNCPSAIRETFWSFWPSGPSGAFGCVLSRLMIICGESNRRSFAAPPKQQETQRGIIVSDSTKQIGLLAVVTCLVFTGVASASPLGTANISNCTPNGGVTVSATTITWLPAAGANLGCIATDPPTSISFSGGTFTSGTGTISDLPAGSTNPWVVLGGVLDFSLSAFVAPAPTDGVCSTSVALALGHSCITAIGSPFLLISQGATTAVSLIANGVVTDTGDASTSNYQGIFTTQLTVTTAQIAATLDGGGSVNTTYSATLSVEAPTGTPEPGTISMFLLGGVALAGLGRKRFGKH